MISEVFNELQRPAPWPPEHERRVFADGIEQAMLADQPGYGCWWPAA